MVSGVYKKGTSRLDKLSGNDEATIYMSYSSLAQNGSVSYINTYEALMPNPVGNYAKDAIKDSLSIDAKRYEIIENSSRFNWVNLLKRLGKYGTWGMNSKGVIYPYWENMARGMEDYLTPITLLAVILFLYPGVLLLIILIRMWKKRRIHVKDVKDFFEDKYDDYRVQRRKAKEGDI